MSVFGSPAIVSSDLQFTVGVLKEYNNFQKHNTFSSMLFDFMGKNNVVFSNGSEWKHHRTIINPSFGKISLFMEPMSLKIDEFIDVIETRAKMNENGVTVCDDIQKMTLDVLGVCVLGEDYHFMSRGDEDNPLCWYRDIVQFASKYPMRALGIFNKFPFPSTNKAWKAVTKFNNYIKTLFEQHTINPSKYNKKSLIASFIDAVNNKSLTYEEARNNITVFFLAGHETTSISMQYILYNLSKYPEYQKRLRAEILKQFPGDNLDYESVKDFEIITNVVNETLRLFSPITFLPGRISTEDSEVNGWFIPKGTQIIINIWNIHHSKELWGEDVNEFNPDRFENLNKMQKSAFLAFGGGARICLGQTFSLLEQKIFLIKLLKKFEVSWAPDSSLEISPAFYSPKAENFKFIFKPIERQS